jgi:hypothetical protein
MKKCSNICWEIEIEMLTTDIESFMYFYQIHKINEIEKNVCSTKVFHYHINKQWEVRNRGEISSTIRT